MQLDRHIISRYSRNYVDIELLYRLLFSFSQSSNHASMRSFFLLLNLDFLQNSVKIKRQGII